MNNITDQLSSLLDNIRKCRPRTLSTPNGDIVQHVSFTNTLTIDLQDGIPVQDDDTTTRALHELLFDIGSTKVEQDISNTCNATHLVDKGISRYTNALYDAYRKKRIAESKSASRSRVLSIKDFTERLTSDFNFSTLHGDAGTITRKQWTDLGGYTEIVEMVNTYKETFAKTILVDQLGTNIVRISGKNQVKDVINRFKCEPGDKFASLCTWNPHDIDDALVAPLTSMIHFHSEILDLNDRITTCVATTSEQDISAYMSKLCISSWSDTARNPLLATRILDHFNVPGRKLSANITANGVAFTDTPYLVTYSSLLLSTIAHACDMVPGTVNLNLVGTSLATDNSPVPDMKLAILAIDRSIESINNLTVEDYKFYEKNNSTI